MKTAGKIIGTAPPVTPQGLFEQSTQNGRQYFRGHTYCTLNMFYSILGEGTGFLFVNITDTSTRSSHCQLSSLMSSGWTKEIEVGKLECTLILMGFFCWLCRVYIYSYLLLCNWLSFTISGCMRGLFVKQTPLPETNFSQKTLWLW